MIHSNRNRYAGRRAFVLGLGQSGQASARFLLRRGAAVTAIERHASSSAVAEIAYELGIAVLDDSTAISFTAQDLLILSPGIPSTHHIVQHALSSTCEVIGEVELALREITQRAVAISGTNGKTTVTLLVAHILRSIGIEVVAAGNLGTYGLPLTAAVDLDMPSSAAFVVELSSYQLESAETAIFSAAVLLNITQDHLDRYASLEEYAKAKARLQNLLAPSGTFFLQEASAQTFPTLFFRPHQLFGWMAGASLHADNVGVWLGDSLQYSWSQHPSGGIIPRYCVENELAAFALSRSFGVDVKQFLLALHSFVPPKHRREVVAVINDTVYYDDSKGTNVDATLQAVASLSSPILLIAGGVDKGSDYKVWRAAFSGKVKAVFLIGEAAAKICDHLDGCVPTVGCCSLADAVAQAHTLAVPGDSVLLSPGCASFDMFVDYADRGRSFQQLVHALR